MRILFLTTHLNTGGITSYLFNLAQGLKDCGHEVFIISSGGNREGDFKKLGVKIYNLSIRTKSELSPRLYLNLGKIRKIVQEERIDLIHAHTRVTQVAGTLVSQSTKVPYLTTCHGYFKNRLSRRLFPCWGNHVIAISTQVKKHLEDDFYVPSQKITLIESGIDLAKFKVVSDSERREAKKKYSLEKFFVVGIIARLSDVKGQDILIRAMKEVVAAKSDVYLLIVGEGKMEKELKDLTQELGLKNHILFLPIINQTSEILSAMDIFIMPSRQEGLGLSIMEAQACGLPVVGSDVGGIPTLIEHEKTGLLIKPEDPQGLAKAIIRLINENALRAKLGKNARQFIENNYALKRMVDQTLQVYQNLVSK